MSKTFTANIENFLTTEYRQANKASFSGKSDESAALIRQASIWGEPVESAETDWSLDLRTCFVKSDSRPIVNRRKKVDIEPESLLMNH